MRLNSLFLLVCLAITSSAQGMTKTAGQVAEVQVETKTENAQVKEGATSSFGAILKLKEENRIRSAYTNFCYTAQKFKDERIMKSKVLNPHQILHPEIEKIIDLGFIKQAKILGRTVLVSTNTQVKAVAEARMNTVISFAEYLFALEEEQLASIAASMAPWIRFGGGERAMPSRKLDDMWRELYNKKFFSQEEMDLMADAFTGWKDILGK